MTRKTKGTPETAKPNPDAVLVYGKPGDNQAELLAQSYLRPTVQAASIVRAYNKDKDGAGPDVNALIAELVAQTTAASNGDLRRPEAMLLTQAHSLDAIFGNLARRAHANIGGGFLDAADRYMRLALKAQSQCRATLETLSVIKNPATVAFVRQANIAHGPQQVNNAAASAGDVSCARETENQQSKLLEAVHGERLDTRTAGTASGADPAMAAMGEIDRAENRARKGEGEQEQLYGRYAPTFA